MLVVLYEFVVKEGSEEIFQENWAIVTDAIRRTCNSLGSRLHKSDTKPNSFIAYAQWPSDEVYDRGLQTHLFTEEELKARDLMKSACESISTLHRMKVTDDRLAQG